MPSPVRPPSPSITSPSLTPPGRATVYDHPLYIPTPTFPERATRHHTSLPASAVLAPEEVLFRRANAPARYAEDDMYGAADDLPDGALPSSDLLKSVHHHVSRYYEALNVRLGGGEDPVDERSMDETALLAFGILLEEAARDALGQEGDLVFTEGEVDEEAERDTERKRRRVARPVLEEKEEVKGEEEEAAVEEEKEAEAVDTDYSAKESKRASKRSRTGVDYNVRDAGRASLGQMKLGRKNV